MDLGSAPLPDSKGTDSLSDGMLLAAPEQETANVAMEGNRPLKQRDQAHPQRDCHLSQTDVESGRRVVVLTNPV